MPAARRVLRIGLLWHSLSSDNLGVGALTESQLALCREAAELAGVDLEFVLFGTSGGQSYGPQGVKLAQGSAVSVRQMPGGRSAYEREVAACDAVLDIGEGDSFTDIYGLRRFAFMLASKQMVLRQGVPLVLSPQTIGPFESRPVRWLARRAMRRCARVFARDELSMSYLESQGLGAAATEVVDVAFRLPFVRPVRDSEDAMIDIGINVSGLLHSGGYAGANQFGLRVDYPQLVRRLIAHFTAVDRHRVWLISHVVPDHLPRDDDRVAVRELLQAFPRARAAPQFGSPSEAKSFISGMDFMTGARMHACIAAISSGVAVVPLAYSRKFNGLFATLGYPWLADGKAQDTDQALQTILDGFERREQLAADARRSNALAQARLDVYRDYLADLFRQCQRA
ncbi:Polysaccharide pyruvyl transferase family protein WcaK [Sphaerotilus natans]|jgi:polysaccharide pyruvyl transferase WcaK-like protein|nr:Polysaccharide pyruvyl transferase family protein WcaK [Sphaerotilus natans]